LEFPQKLKRRVKKERVFMLNQRPAKSKHPKTIKNHIMDKENNYNLFLDDFRHPYDVANYTGNPVYGNKTSWVIVRNYDEFVKCIEERGLPEKISFDHDLADVHYDAQDHVDQDYYDLCEEKTGYHCAQWMINYCLDRGEKLPPVILIHSMNIVGARNIESLFKTFKKVHGDGSV
jgi:hypothetical protein